MNRILLHHTNRCYRTIVEHSSVIYDYKSSPNWHCIEVDNESLCALRLIYMVSHFESDYTQDMPTYILSTYP